MNIRPRGGGEPLTIICTDRGQHRRTPLAEYWHMVDGSDRLTSPFGTPSAIGPGDRDPDAPELAGISTESYVLWCARCGRNPKRADMCERFAQVYDTRMMSELDISLLDW